MSQNTKSYYLPSPSFWPLIASISLFLLASGFTMVLNKIAMGKPLMIAGGLTLAYLLFGWFKEVIVESIGKNYNYEVTSFTDPMSKAPGVALTAATADTGSVNDVTSYPKWVSRRAMTDRTSSLSSMQTTRWSGR